VDQVPSTPIRAETDSYNSETIEYRPVHTAMGLASIELSFHPYNILRDNRRGVSRGNKNVGCGTVNQLHAVTSAVTSVSVSGVDLSVANDMKALGVVLDRRLTFQKHAMYSIRTLQVSGGSGMTCH